jgi:hypothetical protein
MPTRSAPAAAPRSGDFQVSLRIRHPDFDPQQITRQLGLQPDHAWAKGDARKAESGQTLGGIRRDSYWSAMLPDPALYEQMLGQETEPGTAHHSLTTLATADLGMFLTLQLLQLKRHRELLVKLSSEGDAAFVISMTAEPGSTLRLEPALMRQLTDLGLRLEFEFE